MRFPKILVFINGNESIYPKIKQVLKTYQIPSQFVTSRLAMRFNLSVASNVLK